MSQFYVYLKAQRVSVTASEMIYQFKLDNSSDHYVPLYRCGLLVKQWAYSITHGIDRLK